MERNATPPGRAPDRPYTPEAARGLAEHDGRTATLI